jgi:multicomponent Na+:H+ antiporter subunit D
LLALYAFGIGKAALMPFHRWLPAAMVAPTPVSALLHAVAVVKAGVFTVMKVAIYVFGIDELRALGGSLFSASGWLVYVACFTIVAASLVALFQDNLKRRLAYSTISQLSYIVLGAALANQLSVTGGSLHIVTHALGKITLFFCAGAIYVGAHKTEISDMKGIGRQMPFTMFAFLLGSLSIIGLPPFAGMWSKWYLVLGALDAGQIWVVAVLALSSLLNIAYLMPVAINAFFYPPPESQSAESEDASSHHGAGGAKGIHEAPILCVAPLMATALGCVALFFGIDPWIRLVERLGG